jgi:hypothetical protein
MRLNTILPVLFVLILLMNSVLKLVLKLVLNLVLTLRLPHPSRLCFMRTVGV